MKSNQKNHFKFFFLAIASVVLISCEDSVNVTLESANATLNIDAWINDKNETQVISLTLSQSYLDSSTPTGALGATVTVTDDRGVTYSFIESSKQNGNYEWKPSGLSFGGVGRTYTLLIKYKGESYTSTTVMSRSTKVDSITFITEKGAGPGAADIDKAQFWGKDPIGAGDCYWIKTYKNSSLLNLPSDINRAYDAGISTTGNFDGLTFLQPIREAINPLNDTDSNGRVLSPYKNGDSIYVEIHSISKLAFSYLGELSAQTDRPGGIAELFSQPLANVSCNIENISKNGSVVVGFFNVAAVSGLGKRYRK